MEIYLVFVDTIRNSNKFWAAIVEDSNLTVQWGRVGYQAQTKVHTLANHLSKNMGIGKAVARASMLTVLIDCNKFIRIFSNKYSARPNSRLRFVS